jgi:hypothetical protein
MKRLLTAGVASALLSQAVGASGQQAGVFRISRSADPITDKAIVTAMASPTTVTPREIGDPSFVLRCDDGRFDAYVNSGGFLDSSGRIRGIWRVDSGEAVEGDWGRSTDGTSAFVPDGHLIRFVAEIRAGSRLVVRLFDYQGSAHTYTYSLNGSSGALNALGCDPPEVDRYGRRITPFDPDVVTVASIEAGAHPIPSGMNWIAVEVMMTYFPVGCDWWRNNASGSVVFFADEEGAKAAGYRKSLVCGAP